MDLIFYLFVTSSWMTLEENNTVWNGLRGMHGFAIFCSVVITVLKVGIPSFRYLLHGCLIRSGRPWIAVNDIWHYFLFDCFVSKGDKLELGLGLSAYLFLLEVVLWRIMRL
jgi:hypothetical protein